MGNMDKSVMDRLGIVPETGLSTRYIQVLSCAGLYYELLLNPERDSEAHERLTTFMPLVQNYSEFLRSMAWDENHRLEENGFSPRKLRDYHFSEKRLRIAQICNITEIDSIVEIIRTEVEGGLVNKRKFARYLRSIKVMIRGEEKRHEIAQEYDEVEREIFLKK